MRMASALQRVRPPSIAGCARQPFTFATHWLEVKHRVMSAMEHDTLTPVAEIRVPAHGSVEVHYEMAAAKGRAPFVGLIPVGRESDQVLEDGDGTSCSFDWVLPGDYELCFKGFAGERGYEFEDVSARVAVTVRANETSRVVLER